MTDEKDDDVVPLSPDRARELILARRARFMAAALAGLTSAGCDGAGDGPGICLSIQPTFDASQRSDGGDAGPGGCLTLDAAQRGDAGLDSGPRVCLSIVVPCDAGVQRPGCPPADAGSDGGAEGGTLSPPEGGVAPLDASPQVCLSVVVQRAPGDEDESAS